MDEDGLARVKKQLETIYKSIDNFDPTRAERRYTVFDWKDLLSWLAMAHEDAAIKRYERALKVRQSPSSLGTATFNKALSKKLAARQKRLAEQHVKQA